MNFKKQDHKICFIHFVSALITITNGDSKKLHVETSTFKIGNIRKQDVDE